MEAYALLRTLGALGIVLGLLAGALWAVRRFDIRLPGRVSGGSVRRLELVERTPLDGRRSVALLRRDGREHLILLAPEGNLVLETAIIRDAIDEAAEAARVEALREAMEASKAEAEAMRQSFYTMVDNARAGVKDRLQVTGESVSRAAPAMKQVRERVQSVLEQVKSGTPKHVSAQATGETTAPPQPSAPAPAEKPAAGRKRKVPAAQPAKPRQTRTTKASTTGGARA